MKVLVLGGTQFVGRALVEVSLEAGHELTLFHRGKTNPASSSCWHVPSSKRWPTGSSVAGRTL